MEYLAFPYSNSFIPTCPLPYTGIKGEFRVPSVLSDGGLSWLTIENNTYLTTPVHCSAEYQDLMQKISKSISVISDCEIRISEHEIGK